MNNAKLLTLIAAAGSLALLLGAFAFQHLGGLAPCKLCLWQRWPHVAAVLIGAAVLALGNRALNWLGAAAMAVCAGIALYHTGVERAWWEGPSTCTSSAAGDVSADEFFNNIVNAPLIRCDEVAWSLAGLSMASWNGILSLVLMAVWLRAATR